MVYVVCAVLILIWLYVLHVCKRAELKYWRFLIGCFGLFIILIVMIRPVLQPLLSQMVTAISGLFGSLTGTFSAYFKYGVLFVESASESITLQIDMECSGIIEIAVYVSLITFFQVYSRNERIIVGILGVVFIVLANSIRIIVICEIIHFFGPGAYYVSHSLIGRVVFYALSVVLYFYVFTKPHIVRMRVGKFAYGHN